ncbi:MAG: TetR/AcrR family transcriptional regulator [Clostridiales bacterium]|nr:TetR/AcrR family transcriptional regulator [Clostridiales bacterium]
MTLKDKIIQVSYELFATKGYERTTISDIVKASESSKGGFYHHFNSKEDIIDTLLDNCMKDLQFHYNNLFDRYNNDTIKVFNGVFEAITIYKSEKIKRWPEFMNMFCFEGNSLITMRMAHALHKMTEAFYFELIVKGNHKRLWSIDTPSNIAGLWTRELMRIYAEISALLNDYNESNFNKFVSLLEFDEELINRLLSTDQLTVKDEAINYFESEKSDMNNMNFNRYKTLDKIV